MPLAEKPVASIYNKMEKRGKIWVLT